MKKNAFTLGFMVALTTAALAQSPTSAPTKTPPPRPADRHEITTNGFRLVPPKGYDVRVAEQAVPLLNRVPLWTDLPPQVALAAFAHHANYNFKANISVVVTPVPPDTTLDAYMEATRQTLENQHGTIVYQGTVNLESGAAGRLIWTGDVENRYITAMSTVIVANGNAYVLTCADSRHDYPRQVKLFEKCSESFALTR